MRVGSASPAAKAAVIGLLFVAIGCGTPGDAQGATPERSSGEGIDATTARAMGSTAGAGGSGLSDFHMCKEDKTYAVEFQDGLRGSLDFDADTITIQDGSNSIVMS